MSIKYSNNVIFHETIFPGHTFFNSFPPVIGDLSSSVVPSLTSDSFSGAPAEPSLNTKTLNETDMSSPLAVTPSAPSTVVDLYEESSPLVRRPGWDITLQPLHQKATNDISSSISSENIVEHKQKKQNHLLLIISLMSLTRIFLRLIRLMQNCFLWLSLMFLQKLLKALNLAYSQQWLLAIQAEKQSLEAKDRVFDGEGNLVKHKARLCAQGCSQIPGLEYGYTYTMTGAMATLRLILSLGDTNDWRIHHMDAKTSFLNSTLTEDIYLRPPAGLELPP
ncbi:hypothetical protein O181_001135 [Austropuccinia psidii MF-1]|uniref:Reverse transcriptase Ty1/copia-type domain-containing protein n=1 Tax=Austropuccinia psidii MF-1 TaxID=1389203 RepID=A0A9Q3BA35_9BASI|nr:hypothetical protein [Austropuccinia psidii MF-1]